MRVDAVQARDDSTEEVLARVDVDAADDPLGELAEVGGEMEEQVGPGGKQEQTAQGALDRDQTQDEACARRVTGPHRRSLSTSAVTRSWASRRDVQIVSASPSSAGPLLTAVSRSASALVGCAHRLNSVGGGGPAAEELERLFGARAGLGGVGEDRQPVVCGEVQPVKAQAELADDGMVELLDAGVVEAHVVRGPAGVERLALCCELADQV